MFRKFIVMGGLYAVALFLASPYICWLIDDPIHSGEMSWRELDGKVEGVITCDIEGQSIDVEFSGSIEMSPLRIELTAKADKDLLGVPMNIGSLTIDESRAAVDFLDYPIAFNGEIGNMIDQLDERMTLVDRKITAVDFAGNNRLAMEYTYSFKSMAETDIKLTLAYEGLGKSKGILVEVPIAGTVLFVSGHFKEI